MKKVLVVDDTAVVRSFLTRAFKPHASKFEVVTAENGKEAADIIQNFKIDLVITDVEMPVMDGFALLAYISSNCPEIPVFVMTANDNPEFKERASLLGSLKFFEKPMNIDVLIDSIFEELHAGAQGKIEGIGLAAFLQLIDMEQKTCTLTVECEGMSGFVYCLRGGLIAAETGDLKNEEAIFQMLAWDVPAIKIENVCAKKENEINQPLMSVLMEGLKLRDEKKAAQKAKVKPLAPRSKGGN